MGIKSFFARSKVNRDREAVKNMESQDAEAGWEDVEAMNNQDARTGWDDVEAMGSQDSDTKTSWEDVAVMANQLTTEQTPQKNLEMVCLKAVMYPDWSKEKVESMLDDLMTEPEKILAVLSHRTSQTLSEMDRSTYEFRPNKVFADLTFINGAIERGFDLNETKINLKANNKGEDIESLDFALSRLSHELDNVRGDTRITDPDRPEDKILATTYIRRIKERAVRQKEDREGITDRKEAYNTGITLAQRFMALRARYAKHVSALDEGFYETLQNSKEH